MMRRISIFIDLNSLNSSNYDIDIFQIPGVICNELFKITGSEISTIRKFIFISSPSNEQQLKFANSLIQEKFDVITSDYMNSVLNVSMACKLIEYLDIYDIGIIVSGNIALYPAIKYIRNNGKQVMICGLSEKIDDIYKNTNYETGPLDFDLLYLDNKLDTIANKIINNISTDSILDEIKSEFFDGNIDYDSINIKKYITYWGIRARYLQIYNDNLNEKDQETVKRVFEKINELSSEYQPGYVKILSKKFSPNSWEDEISIIPKIW